MSSNIQNPIPPVDPEHTKGRTEPDFGKVVQEAIIQDPIIEDSDRVSVKFEDKGLGKAEMHLIGKVGSEKQKQRALELAESNTTDKIEVINEIIVE